MQAYQSHTAIQGGLCPGALNLYPIEERMGASPIPTLSFQQERILGRGRPAVPVCPGHVRRFHPYPPSRRRRR